MASSKPRNSSSLGTIEDMRGCWTGAPKAFGDGAIEGSPARSHPGCDRYRMAVPAEVRI
jgi:hypothetical protein